MTERYPRFKRHTPRGLHILSDGLVLNFFIRRPHVEIGRAVAHTLDIYRQFVGPEKLKDYLDLEGYHVSLNAETTKYVHEQLTQSDGCVVRLLDSSAGTGEYRFDYWGRALGTGSYLHQPDAVSSATFWLPTHDLEERGPECVRELALSLARELPIVSGYVSPAFNGLMDTRHISPLIQEFCFRYPGIDIIDADMSFRLGTRPKGSYWLNFYGQPLLNALGGTKELRAQLPLPGITVEEIQPDKVLVQLGEWPEVEGDMSAYRQLARVLEPHLYQEARPILPPEVMRRWERRFLD